MAITAKQRSELARRLKQGRARKLPSTEVLILRYLRGDRVCDIAEEYGVSREAVYSYLRSEAKKGE